MQHRTTVLLVASSLAVLGCKRKEGEARSDPAPPNQPALDTATIERLTGQRGTLDPESGAFKVTSPRTDLTVTLGEGGKLTPPQGLTSWAAFQSAGDHVMVMGDIVLTEDQVTPALTAALDAGLDVTGLHNHFLWEQPRIMFMHIGGMGDQAKLATAVGAVFAKLEATKGGQGERAPAIDIDPASSNLDPARLDAIFGKPGEYKAGVYKATIGRTTKMHDVTIGSAMGVNTWAAFAGTDDHAIVDGDFAMLEGELQTVLKTLRGAHIDIVAIHQHMVGEQPRIMFLHYVGVGPAEDLAKTIKAALDTQAR